MNEGSLLDCFRRIQAVAQNGATCSRDPFDLARFEELQGLAAEGLSLACGGEVGDWESLLRREKGYATPKLDVRGAVFREGLSSRRG